MKKLIAILLLTVSFSNAALASCDFKGLVHNQDGSVIYSKDQHICVGQMIQDLGAANVQIGEYKKAIELKDLALTKSNERADMWMDTSFKLQDRLNAVDSLKAKNEYLAFGLGIVVTGLAVWGAGYLHH